MSAVYTFAPVGIDLFDRRAHQPAPGTRVVKTQPAGAPRNGTMGHCYVSDARTGQFYGLVLEASLVRARMRSNAPAPIMSSAAAADRARRAAAIRASVERNG